MSKHAATSFNLVNVDYARDGSSVNTDALGMREMQQRVFAERNSQHLLVKAPPASGKSRALMFVALDKLFNQGINKVIVAVPEKSIGGSFGPTDLMSHGFFANWDIKPENNLCLPGGTATGKIAQFKRFLLESTDAVLVCTHATLRYAFEELNPEDFNGTLLAIDEFHHVSSDTENNRLGALLKRVMREPDVHVVAMTGSYFRGDSVPVLSPEDEAKFTTVTFNYYDQLNGYRYLKSLGIGHHFYQGRYPDAIDQVLDLDKKTIIHIPSVNSGESTKDKMQEVGIILDHIGETETEDEHGILNVRRKDNGQILRVADLVDDSDQIKRARTLAYLSTVAAKDPAAVDIVIALGMAKEGFDWPSAEHALTIGYRASLTEVIQIIGRVTRDSPGKEHAQFTNLLAEPDASGEDTKGAVNNILKAITASLLMEQVLAPNFTFKAKRPADSDDAPKPGELRIAGLKEPSSERVSQILSTDLNDLKADLLQRGDVAKLAFAGADPETVNKVLVPKVIRERYPDLSDAQVEEVRQHVVTDSVIKNGDVKAVGDQRFIKMQDKFVNVDDLSINLIDSVNPFQKAFEVMSKQVTPRLLRQLQKDITVWKIDMTDEEALKLWPKVLNFIKVNGKRPSVNSTDTNERYLGVAARKVLQIRKAHERAARKSAHNAEQESAQNAEGGDAA